MTALIGKDMEALVDLFLSPDFQPFVEKPAVSTMFMHPASAGYDWEFESDVIVSDDEETDAVVPFHNDVLIKKCGQAFAKAGSEYFELYSPKQSRSTVSETPWQTVSDKVRGIILKAVNVKGSGSNADQEKENAWAEFKGILESSVSDNVVGDVYKYVGALLLTLHGLSNMTEGATGLARAFFLRYIRDRQLDAQIERIGGLEPLMFQDLD